MPGKSERWVVDFEEEIFISWSLVRRGGRLDDYSIAISVDFDSKKEKWILHTPLEEIEEESRDDVLNKAAGWMKEYTDSEEIARLNVRRTVFEILNEPSMSFLANGKSKLVEQVEYLIQAGSFKLGCDELEEVLVEIGEESTDGDVPELISCLRDKRSDFERYIKKTFASRRKYEKQVDQIEQKVHLLNDAELVTNRDLEGEDILILSWSFKGDNEHVLCHVKSDESRLLKFKPTSHQRAALPILKEEKYPFRFRVARTHNKLFVLIQPEVVHAVAFEGQYLFRVYQGKQRSFVGAMRFIEKGLTDFFDKDSRVFALPDTDALEKAKDIISQTNYYDFVVIDDARQFLVFCGVDEDPFREAEIYNGETMKYYLSRFALTTKIEGDRKLILLTSEHMVKRAVSEYGVQRMV